MIYLLDVNVLIALCDPAHPHAGAARVFFSGGLTRNGWATCALVQNGFLRIFGSRKYSGGPGSPQAARPLLSGLLAMPGHQFWNDDVSFTEEIAFPNLPAPDGLTDLYFLGLAVKHGGRFATFDQTVDATRIPGGPASYYRIPTP
jgi:uncharacterized protein